MAFLSGWVTSLVSLPPIIKVEKIIEAPSERVWAIITDFRNCGWNPTLEKIEAIVANTTLQEGSQYNITCVWSESEKQVCPIKILKVLDKQELVWSDETAPLVVTPTVTRSITPLEDGARVTMTIKVEITGLMALAVHTQYSERILRQIQTEIDALKIHAEKPI